MKILIEQMPNLNLTATNCKMSVGIYYTWEIFPRILLSKIRGKLHMSTFYAEITKIYGYTQCFIYEDNN